MYTGLVLIVVGAIATLLHVSKGGNAANDANLAGVLWHLFFTVAGAYTLALGLGLAGYI